VALRFRRSHGAQTNLACPEKYKGFTTKMSNLQTSTTFKTKADPPVLTKTKKAKLERKIRKFATRKRRSVEPKPGTKTTF
jgi:hypothetical protein